MDTQDAVVLISPVRTPIGNFGGAFQRLSAVDLGVEAARATLERSGIARDRVDLTIIGIARQAGCGPNPARQVAHRVGIPHTSPAFTVNMACASSLLSIIEAARAIRLGDARVVLTGGMESMSRVPYMLDRARFEGYRLGHGTLIDGNYRDGFLDPLSNLLMGETAENLVDRYQIPRREQDEYALLSHRRAVAAIDGGLFQDEIEPVTVPPARKGEPMTVTTDEHPRRDTNMEKLGRLRPVFRENGTVTAGNSSGMTDGASAMIVASASACAELGLEPWAILEDYTVVGVEPEIMGIGPVPAVRGLLQRLGRTLDNYGTIECNEAFAAQVLAVERELQWDREKVNVHGGAIALGHPIGATGARIVTTLLHAMRRRGTELGLATLCVSGGLGVAMSFRLSSG